MACHLHLWSGFLKLHVSHLLHSAIHPKPPTSQKSTALPYAFHTPPSGRLMIWCCLFLGRRVQLLQHSNHLIILSSAFQIQNLSQHFLQLSVNCSSSLVNKTVNVKAEKNPQSISFLCTCLCQVPLDK